MYIGIDLGTTACKAARLDEAGAVQAFFHKEYGLICQDGRVEQDAEIWYQLVLEALTAVGAPTVEGISISTQGIALVPVDEAGKPLCNAISWLDTRGSAHAKDLKQAVGEDEISAVTGRNCTGAYVLPKLMWLKENRPDIWAKAHKFLMPLDYLNLRLTGRAVTDYTMAGGTMAWDLQKKVYDARLLAFAGVEEKKLPKVACMGAKVGRLLPEVAQKTGLPESCVVYLGGQDQKLAALGAGIDEACVTVSLGTATAVSRLMPQTNASGASLAPPPTDATVFRFDENHYSTEGVLDTSGAALKWLMGILHQPDYQAMNALAEQAGSSGGVVFYTDMTAGGCIENLKLETTPGQLVYALMEGVSRSVGQMAGSGEKLVLFGGGAKSEVWCRIMAQTTGKTVCVTDTAETGIRGAAMLASQGKLQPAAVTKIYEP